MKSPLFRSSFIGVLAAFLLFAISITYFPPVYADSAASSTSAVTDQSQPLALGADVDSYNCGGPMPKGQAFGIVDVNETGPKSAIKVNHCLPSEIRWAERSTGKATGQPKVQFLVSIADPGNSSTDWPTSGSDPLGKCTSVNGKGRNTPACGFIYGKFLAEGDVDNVKAVTSNHYPYWLEVLNNVGYSLANPTLNASVLDGMVSYFEGTGSSVGIFSDQHDWQAVAGTVSKTEFKSLYGLKNWYYHSQSLQESKAVCNKASQYSFDNGKLSLVLFVANIFDQDLAC